MSLTQVVFAGFLRGVGDMVRRKTWATTYKLFSEMKPEEKEALLATATQKVINPMPSGAITHYNQPVSGNELFAPHNQDLLVMMRGKELLGSVRFARETVRGEKQIVMKRIFVFPKYRYLGIGTGLFARLKIISKKKFGLKLLEYLDDFEPPVRRMSKKIAGRKKNILGKKLKSAYRPRA